jgi:CheY-like chemotaxis protein
MLGIVGGGEPLWRLESIRRRVDGDGAAGRGAVMNHDGQPRARILVVDDDGVAAEGIGRLLQRRGFAVRTAVDLPSAVAQARDWPPDVAICDWQLAAPPDGIEVARALHRLHGSTIVMITAYEIDALSRASADLSVTSYLRKPIAFDALIRAVDESLQ